MNDDTGIDERPAAPVRFEHWCEEPGCSKWGGRGYDVGRGETRWYCYKHRWHNYPQPKDSGE
jgi:hypothetical protein